jgi:hypothetical protein
MITRNQFSYMVYGQEDSIKLMIKTPVYSNVTDLCTIPNNLEGIVANLTIKNHFGILAIRNNGCWAFAVTHVDEDTPIPPNWIIEVQQSYLSKCSTSIRILTPNAIIFKSEIFLNERT